jgi:hypothetical protein
VRGEGADAGRQASDNELPEAPGRPVATGLPLQLTSFVGRAREVAELTASLTTGRLVVLTGAGGTGKTRLALRAAEDDAIRWPDGLGWVPLASLTDQALVGTAIAHGLGVRPPPGRSAMEAVTDRLAHSRVLLVLDDCEHVVDAAAEACDTILRSCPQVTILATSRTTLGVAGERTWPVPPSRCRKAITPTLRTGPGRRRPPMPWPCSSSGPKTCDPASVSPVRTGRR